jgi:hypothetical protein
MVGVPFQCEVWGVSVDDRHDATRRVEDHGEGAAVAEGEAPGAESVGEVSGEGSVGEVRSVHVCVSVIVGRIVRRNRSLHMRCHAASARRHSLARSVNAYQVWGAVPHML